MIPSPPLCNTITPKSMKTGKWVIFPAPHCLLRLLDPAPKHLFGISWVTMARSLGVAIRLHANRLLPTALQKVTDDKVHTTRLRRLALSSEDNDRRFNEPSAPKASRPLAMAASVNRRHVRHQYLDRHNPANSAAMNTDRHPHSNRTGGPDHF